MKKNTLFENFSELNSAVKNYLEAKFEYYKLILLEKTTKVGTYFLSTIVILLLLLFVLLFGAFAFSYWYGEHIGTLIEGFLISAGFFFVLALVAFFLRKPLFSNNIVRNLASTFFDDNQEEKK